MKVKKVVGALLCAQKRPQKKEQLYNCIFKSLVWKHLGKLENTDTGDGFLA